MNFQKKMRVDLSIDSNRFFAPRHLIYMLPKNRRPLVAKFDLITRKFNVEGWMFRFKVFNDNSSSASVPLSKSKLVYATISVELIQY